ncbi:MAG TPA: (Fe-S)-binding protein, partial [Methylococcaceae bacterium]|nr:(Fe-S)-binding protein [Methylococcaceae bacterium]
MTDLDALLKDADRCVKCGLCLPHCPTYHLTGDESESPRGRIALIEAWAKGALPDSEQLQTHVDQCLLCRACERMCPAQVPYASLVDRFRAATRPPRRKLVSQGVRFGLDALSSFSRMQPYYPAEGAQRGEIMLFTGCTGTTLDRTTVRDALFVLSRLGVAVHVPERQTCCGALDQHAGNADRAQGLIGGNLAAFEGDVPVVYVASGCGAFLKDYGQYAEGGADFAARATEFCAYLARLTVTEHLRWHPVLKRAVLHIPCTLRGGEAATESLLRQIPEISLTRLDWSECCGAAGSYMLEHPRL